MHSRTALSGMRHSTTETGEMSLTDVKTPMLGPKRSLRQIPHSTRAAEKYKK